jgi:hypothetical protein
MASIILDPKYNALADDLVALIREEGIVMTQHAEALLRFSVEAFLEDTPRAILTTQSINLQQQAKSIVTRALKDPHFANRKAARFTDMMVALSDAGKQTLRDVFDKGF